jgi:hypothetical protein
MSRVANKNGMIARRATPVAATTRYWRSQPLAGVAACCHSRTSRSAHRVMAAVSLRCQGAQHRERPFLSQPFGHTVLRAVCGVRLLAKGRSRHVTAQQPIAGATAGDHSRTSRFAHRVMVATLRVVAFLAYSPADTLPRSGRLREAGHGRHSRTSGLRPPCHAAYPRKTVCAVMRDLIRGSLMPISGCVK